MAVKEFPISENINDLVYVKCTDGYRGWRVDLLAVKLENSLDEKFLLCMECGGLLREASVIVTEEQLELRCFACNPFLVGFGQDTPTNTDQDAVDKLLVVCPLRKRGCGWKDQIRGLLQHLEICVHILVFCPQSCVNKENKRLILERRLMVLHYEECPMREVACEHCSDMIRTYKIELHKGTCEKNTVPCPNNCGKKVPRNSVDAHLSVYCPLQVVTCSYREYGCEKMMERKLVNLHEREYLHSHFKLTCISTKKAHAEQTEKIQKLETENKQKYSKLKKLERALSFVIPSCTLRIKLGQINSLISKGLDTYIDPFYVGLYKCRARFDWGAETGYMGCYLCIMKGEWDDKLVWPFRFKMEVTLVNQETGGVDFSVSVTSSDLMKRGLQNCHSALDKPVPNATQFLGIPSFKAITSLSKSKYNRDDSITLLIKVEQMEI